MSNVSDNAHNFGPIFAEVYELANRRLSRPEDSCHGFIDEDHGFAARTVRLTQITTFFQLNTQRFDIAITDKPRINSWLRILLRINSALCSRGPGAIGSQWQSI